MDYSLVSNHIVFDIDEILEMIEEYIEEYLLLEHYFEDQLIESSIIYLEDIEVEYDPGDTGRYFKQKYIQNEADDKEFSSFLRNTFATSLFINDSIEIEIQNGRMVCLLGNRGELILRTGLDSFIFSPLFKLSIKPDNAQVLLNAVISAYKKNYENVAPENIDSYSMFSGVCLMALAKINELPTSGYELNLSHDEMLLFGLALNLAGENADKETLAITRSIIKQIKQYFPEIEHISPESFESTPRMGKILDFKKPDNQK
ncbi:MAG: hypothetical protein PHP51_08250 [Desulfotomaculaceae bacterium]|nr:hypothetical protein [Desulfotomaculaceae bacterium]MDD4767605.1 hypothetical protein [Desulfotomaculaceae bacterium]